MKLLKTIPIFSVLLSLLFSFNVFAMNNINDPERPTPQNEKINSSNASEYRWTWLNNETCVRYRFGQEKAEVERQYNIGTLETWRERVDEKWVVKTRNTFSGKWFQSSEGIWSFVFDDCTIPVGVTQIDGVLYAFNTYGELKADYEYYDGIKTGADGLVTADSAEFTQWLATQYLPECTSHE
ncbi:hypothetical protein [Lacrimispora sp.]|uniref:hypothetical protein n=1 Tax=Lacrimispora sp. TaxID=2719234 RepID=UPI00289C0584|nr:hypothetical protein [Lacrimispora sp.]